MKKGAITFIMPCYNAAKTVEASLASIFNGNLDSGDEVIVADDGSTDGSREILKAWSRRHRGLRVLRHPSNRGGSAARNTAVKAARNGLIFCLDSDNLLEPGSIGPLRRFLLETGADVATFGAVHYFRESPGKITHAWVYQPGPLTLSDCLSGIVVPGASGNYLYTLASWKKVGGYPERCGALDTWGFGLRQVALGFKMLSQPGSHYLHRYGYSSYWVREGRPERTAVQAHELLKPFAKRLTKESRDFLRERGDQPGWFEDLLRHPLRVEGEAQGHAGRMRRDSPALMRLLPLWLRMKSL